MKKIIYCMGIVMLLLVGSALAGEIYGLNDNTYFHLGNINDNNVYINSDKLNGITANEIVDNSINANQVYRDNLYDTVMDNDNKWSKDEIGGGIGINVVIDWFYDTAINYLNTIFVTKYQYELLNTKINLIAQEVNVKYDYSIKELRINRVKELVRCNHTVITEDNITCYRDLTCHVWD